MAKKTEVARRRIACWCLVALVLLLAVALRTNRYAANPPLRVDEVRISLNVLNRSFAKLVEPLDYEQGAPLGFLWLTKLSTASFGESEYILRLLPFAAGILSLVLFFGMSRAILDDVEVVAALFLFAFAARIVATTYDVKQYSTDILATITVTAIVIKTHSSPRTAIRTAVLGLTFVTAIVLSHPATFVVAGALIVLLVNGLQKRDWQRLRADSLLGATSLAAFGLLYVLNLRDLAQHNHMLRHWRIDFAPVPMSISDMRWFQSHLMDLIAYPGLRFPGLVAVLCLLGGIAIWRRNSMHFALLVLPVALALLASALHKYPFAGRLMLFASPLLIPLIAAGIGQISYSLGKGGAFFVPLVCLLLMPVNAPDNRNRPEIKPVLRHVAAQEQEAKTIYANFNIGYLFTLYADRHKLPDHVFLLGPRYATADDYVKDVTERLKGKGRVWVILQHRTFVGRGRKHADLQTTIPPALDALGARLDEVHARGVSGYLYDLP